MRIRWVVACSSLAGLLACQPKSPGGGKTGDSDSGAGTDTGTGDSVGSAGESGGAGQMACSGYDASQVATIPAGSGLFEGDAELAMLEGIRCVDGHLTILQVTSLDPLSLLEKVTGSLSIDAPVPSVVPLANLRQVGSLSIEGTEAFSLSGLESLERVGDLSIGALRASSTVESSPDKGNDRLTDLSALAGAVVVDSVVVGDNDALEDLTGLPVPTGGGTYTPSVEITLNPKLPSSQIDAYLAQVPPGTDVERCGNLNDPPCEAIWPD